MKFAYALLAALVLTTGCSRSTPAPAAPAPPPPTPTVQPAPPPVAAVPAIRRLAAGGWPGSNTHRWGSRHYELRTVTGQLEVRIHDAIDFQGVGMQPSDMSPTRHSCTAWEPAPAPISLPAANATCGNEAALCAAIDSHFKATTRASDDWHHTFGRGLTDCG